MEVIPMKKVLSLICALFVTVAFAGVTLAADKEMKPTPTDNTMKAPKKKVEKAPKKKVEKAPEKKMEEAPAEKK
jgi:hypothetical protein